jgi:hypothetical protein
MKLAIPLPKTPDGRVYRYSPDEAAQPRHFVIGDVKAEITITPELQARMKLTPRSKQTVCPYSGTVAADGDFTHPEDLRAARAVVEHAAVQDMHDEIARMFKGLGGSTSRNSFIKFETKVSNTRRPKPRFSRRDLMRELVCDHCGRDYGVFAIGLFCCDCGAPNLRLHFAREAELVGDQVTLADGLGEGKAELAYRLLGNAHEDVLTAFEATQKTVYIHGTLKAGATEPPKVGNAFQNVERSRKLFAELSVDPFDGLTDTELKMLQLNIQKRHVIGHNLGVADDKFATHAVDAKVGETVHIVGEDIRTFAALCQKVIDRLDTWLGGSPSPTIGTAPLLVTIKVADVHPDDPHDLMGLELDLSLLARKVALWTAQNCLDGRSNFVSRGKLREAFSEASELELREAVAELKSDGFALTSGELTGGLPSFRPTLDLYLAFDEAAFGTKPHLDAAEIAELALKSERGVDVDELFKATGWTLRRFNPALEHVAAQVDDRRVLRSSGTQFSVSTFVLADTDRVALRRFIARLKG